MLDLNVPVATPAGWTKVGDLRVSDEVFDRHGHVCAVAEVSQPFGGRDCAVVRTKDGEAVTASVSHMWPIQPRTDGREAPLSTLTLTGPTTRVRRSIRSSGGLDLPDRALPAHPYLLGVWIGDGNTGQAIFRSNDPWAARRIQSLGYPCREGSRPGVWYLSDPGARPGGEPGRVRVELIKAGVFDRKHLPIEYLRASRSQRMALLQGLADVDGFVSPRGQVIIQSKDRRRLEEIQELLASLGAKASIGERTHRRTGRSFSVQFRLAEAATVPEKAARCRDSRSATTRTVWAEGTRSSPVRAVKVDSPDGAFLVGRTLLPTYGGKPETGNVSRLPGPRNGARVGVLR